MFKCTKTANVNELNEDLTRKIISSAERVWMYKTPKNLGDTGNGWYDIERIEKKD